MNVSGINSFRAVPFKSSENKKSEYENPISKSTERNLAIWGSIGGSALLGTISGFLAKTFGSNKMAIAVGAAVAGITMAFTLPAKLYNTKVSATVKQKEMDVFTRDRDLKSTLTEKVLDEVKDDDVSLDKKLDDNLKLQMANKGSALGIANLTSQAQG